MEPKLIIYLIIGVLYFFYSIGKKAQEKKNAAPPPKTDTDAPQKPVSPPTANPMDDIMREIKKRQAELEAKKKLTAPKTPQTVAKQKPKPPKEIFVHERKQATFEEGSSSASVYERPKEIEDLVHKEEKQIGSEGAYKQLTVAEQTIEDDNNAFKLDVRQAFIGSLIFERKY